MLTTHSQRVGPSRRIAIKTANEMRALARIHTDIAIDTLVEIASDVEKPSSARISASNSILDRAWGKPSQQIIFDAPDESAIIELVSDAQNTTDLIMDAPLQIYEVKKEE